VAGTDGGQSPAAASEGSGAGEHAEGEAARAVVIVIAILLLVVQGLIELIGRPHRDPRPHRPSPVGETWPSYGNKFDDPIGRTGGEAALSGKTGATRHRPGTIT
jgi:hypothetical protein